LPRPRPVCAGSSRTSQGDFAGAHKIYEQALAMRQPAQPDVATAEKEMALVQLSIEEGHVSADMEASVRRIVPVFHDANQTNTRRCPLRCWRAIC
jgi:hypothetical protein